MTVGYVNLSVTIYGKKGITDRYLKNNIPLKLWNYQNNDGKKCIGDKITINYKEKEYIFFVVLDTISNRLIMGTSKPKQNITFHNNKAVILYYKYVKENEITNKCIVRFEIANDKYSKVIFLVPNVSKIVKLKTRDYYNELEHTPVLSTPQEPKILVPQCQDLENSEPAMIARW